MDRGMGGIVGQQYDNKEKGGSRSGRSDMEEKFRTVTLVDVLREAKAPAVIDYLSLDIEGAEEEALSEAALEAYTFLVITVERPTSTLVKRMVRRCIPLPSIGRKTLIISSHRHPTLNEDLSCRWHTHLVFPPCMMRGHTCLMCQPCMVSRRRSLAAGRVIITASACRRSRNKAIAADSHVTAAAHASDPS
mmetsp:Transcript_37556/g.118411  ORF Transcript_37556/g.118411 Transcript_37556/m.118411 type:complete len:191 (+) Transcript_37556:1422-1994(+)